MNYECTTLSERTAYIRTNIDTGVLNSMRRYLLSDVSNPGVLPSDVHIKLNTTKISNDTIQQRISLIPFRIDGNPSDYVFHLSTSQTRIITTHDFECTYLGHPISKISTNQIFPLNPTTMDPVCIFCLDDDDKGAIILEWRASMGNSRTHVGYSPITICIVRRRENLENLENDFILETLGTRDPIDLFKCSYEWVMKRNVETIDCDMIPVEDPLDSFTLKWSV